jgi:hypothetical protein
VVASLLKRFSFCVQDNNLRLNSLSEIVGFSSPRSERLNLISIRPVVGIPFPGFCFSLYESIPNPP